ncbi:uncharacterized protein LOC143283702 isoform X2 [Babylonia areolata]|uniref:uncharacterized protein LOC143283702 isoform X2 n=1 Tax=Babylonia areolata TaxID=304850 RepID=UPI003FD0D6ED
MSVSDEEAFESAEEGDSGKAEGKASSGKAAQGDGSSQASSKAGSSHSGGKQKGKQQQQQRKGKAKAQAKPAADKKEKPGQKKPAAEKPKASPSPAATSTKVESEDTKEEVKSAAAPPETAPLESVKSSSAEKPPAEAADSSGAKQGSVMEKDSDKEKQTDRKTPEKVQDTEEPSQKNMPAEPSEPQVKSAGEIRQSLSSGTEDSKTENPADQSILRDSGDAAGDGAKADSEQKESRGDSDGGGGWGWGWGSTLLNVATNSLETFSSQVGEGLTTIIDSVESSFGVPDPQELAQADAGDRSEQGEKQTVTVQPHEKEGSEEPQVEKEKEKETTQVREKAEEEQEGASAAKAAEPAENPQQGSSWLSGWGMSSISNMGKSLVNKSQNLMNTGFEKAETLAAGGLDILETIGKKTYTTLTEHDPGLRRAREFLHLRGEKPSLSSMLKEAQERAEEEAKHNEELEEARKCNFTALFEDNQGLAHLEALEMLSNQSERKVQSLLSAMEEETLETIRLQLLDIKEIFQKACEEEAREQSEEETEHDFSKLVTENLTELHLGTAPDKLNKVQETVRQWIADFYAHEDHSEISDPKEIQQRAVQSLADVTSKAVEQYHKAGELVLMQKDEDKSCTHRASSLAKLCSVLVTEVDILANKFSQCLNKIGEEKSSMEEVSPMVTSVYLEASNASGYIQDAFQLLLPVLQHAAIQSVL